MATAVPLRWTRRRGRGLEMENMQACCMPYLTGDGMSSEILVSRKSPGADHVVGIHKAPSITRTASTSLVSP